MWNHIDKWKHRGKINLKKTNRDLRSSHTWFSFGTFNATSNHDFHFVRDEIIAALSTCIFHFIFIACRLFFYLFFQCNFFTHIWYEVAVKQIIRMREITLPKKIFTQHEPKALFSLFFIYLSWWKFHLYIFRCDKLCFHVKRIFSYWDFCMSKIIKQWSDTANKKTKGSNTNWTEEGEKKNEWQK